MRALCPSCGGHHDVAQVLEFGIGDVRHDVYQIVPIDGCSRAYVTDKELMEARARFDVEAIVPDDNDD
jgi:hypothetical protein